ncbi:MAG: DUF962 domain-containing protein [Candidatus Dormibacteria bacterium]
MTGWMKNDTMPLSPPPEPSAPFAEKMEYYRSLHTSIGVRATHLIGIPTVAASLPLLLIRPRLGLKLFAGGWALQVAGHVIFEHNSPAVRSGPVSYQLVGLAFWAEEATNLIARLNAKRPKAQDPDASDSIPSRHAAQSLA